MISLSGKYGGALVALLLVASLPGVATLRGERRTDPCRSPDALKATSLIPGTRSLGEQLESLTPDTFQWSEGEVAHPLFPDRPLRFQILRSYDGRWLYERPVRFAFEKLEPEDQRVIELDVDGERLPIHVVWDHTQAPSRLVAYFFAFDNRPVRTPILAQVRRAIGLAVGGPRPLTLAIVAGAGTPSATGAVESAASAWLVDAWRFVARSCRER